jgi:hypothetical protein
MFFKNKNLNIVLVLILVVIIFTVISLFTQPKPIPKQNIEGFNDLINLEKFVVTDNNIDKIKTDLSDIKTSMSSGYPDMSKYALKSELPPTTNCRVSNAVDRDAYIAKTDTSELSKLVKCPVPANYNPEDYISKTAALQPQLCPECPSIDTSKYVLKSTLPPAQKCPDCKCPQVKVSAGLCQKCPPPPKCPEPKPCPVVECPPPKPCPPQQECPACPPKEPCPPKICPPCPVLPTPTECPKCCDREVIKILKKTIYVDQNGKEIKVVDETLTTPSPTGKATFNERVGSSAAANPKPTDSAGSDASKLKLSTGSGLATPKPTTNIGTASTSTGGSLLEQSEAGILNYFGFGKPTEAPFVQSYKVADNKTKTCQPNAFNSEFKKFGVYADNSNGTYSMN